MQMNTTITETVAASASQGVGDAVGVPDRHWFVAIVNHNTEKATAEKLRKLGYETYVATQEDMRVWRNGKRAKIDRVVIPSIVFIYCTEAERLQATRLPQIFRFLTNRALKQGDAPAPPAIIPPVQLYKLRFLLGNSDRPVGFTPRPLTVGTRVRVIRGRLRGLEGEVLRAPTPVAQSPAPSETPPETDLLIRLDILGCARVTISPLDLQPLES